MARLEFAPLVYAEIVARATNAIGFITCEGCGLVLGLRRYHVDHTIPEGLRRGPRGKLTAADGKLLGVECCHDPKTREDKAVIARAKRREAAFRGFPKPKSRQRSRLSRPPGTVWNWKRGRLERLGAEE